MNAEKTGALDPRAAHRAGPDPKTAGRPAASERPHRVQMGARRRLPGRVAAGALARELGVDPGCLLAGELGRSPREGGNMKRIKFYVCPVCGEVVYSTGNASVSCCGAGAGAAGSSAGRGGACPAAGRNGRRIVRPTGPSHGKGAFHLVFGLCAVRPGHTRAPFGPSRRPRRACLPCAGPTGTFTVPATGCSCKGLNRARRRGLWNHSTAPAFSFISFCFRLAGAASQPGKPFQVQQVCKGAARPPPLFAHRPFFGVTAPLPGKAPRPVPLLCPHNKIALILRCFTVPRVKNAGRRIDVLRGRGTYSVCHDPVSRLMSPPPAPAAALPARAGPAGPAHLPPGSIPATGYNSARCACQWAARPSYRRQKGFLCNAASPLVKLAVRVRKPQDKPRQISGGVEFGGRPSLRSNSTRGHGVLVVSGHGVAPNMPVKNPCPRPDTAGCPGSWVGGVGDAHLRRVSAAAQV